MYEKIAALLAERGVTAYEVAKETGLVSNAFSEWKKGKAKPSVESLQKLSKYFQKPIEYFLEDESVGK